MKTVHLDPDAVRPNSSRGKVVIVYGPNFDTGLNCDSSPNCGSVWPLGASIPGASERPADNLSSPPAVGFDPEGAAAYDNGSPRGVTAHKHGCAYPPSARCLVPDRAGQNQQEIARSLGLGEGTVKIHVAPLFGKLGVHRRAAIAVTGLAISFTGRFEIRLPVDCEHAHYFFETGHYSGIR